MGDSSFVDYYEVLQVSPNADGETISRVFRHLAKRYHPDNVGTGDPDRFDQLVRAHRALTDVEQRAAYDVRHQEASALRWRLVGEAGSNAGLDDDRSVRRRLLALLYARRRRDVVNPSLGNVDLERMLSCPSELLEFHVWYLKEKKFIERTDHGFAITALGIDDVEDSRARSQGEAMLAERAGADGRSEAA